MSNTVLYDFEIEEYIQIQGLIVFIASDLFSHSEKDITH